jgi:pimeloyl-ACP methyl ester carboxylesterase|nr:hypothetical protein [Kofleriaceae bacterium]
MRTLGAVAAIALFAACGGSSANTDNIPDACNPLGGQGCLQPWPSMTYTKADTTSATGFRLDLPPEGMPTNDDQIQEDPAPWNRWDGFSPVGFLLATFPTGVSAANLPPFSDPAQSLAADSPIVLLNMDTGDRLPFFAEVDVNVPDPAQAALIIRPLARLPEKTRIAVAIRNTVKAADGTDLPVPHAFAAIRDNTPFSHPRFAALAARYDDIFAALSTAGVDKSELVLAWDYVTASDSFLQNDLVTMRGQALPAIGANGANLSFSASSAGSNALAYAMYTGTFKSPNFLTDGENMGNQTDSRINRDATGNPAMMGMRDANFAAFIPSCVTSGTATLPRPTVIFGHGLFGSSADYLNDGFLQSLANQLCVTLVAGDFIGLTSRQLNTVLLAINDMNNAGGLSEMLGQSVIDFIALENLARGPLATSPQFQVNGQPVIDTSKIYYIGGSLGGIMGSVIMAYDPNLVRGVLTVPGGNWSMLFERSAAWFDLMPAAQGGYPDLTTYQLNLALLAMAMEPYDPITTAAHILKDPLFPDQPTKSILEWYSMGDCLVTNISTEMMARETGLTMLAPSVKMPFDLTPMDGPLANGIVAFNDHPTPLPLDTNTPPSKDNGTHSGINQKPAAIRFAQDFLIDSTMTDECLDGSDAVACDCQGSGSPCQ